MNKSYLLSTVCAILFTFITVSANGALFGRLPATPGGTDYQAYYDDQLDITWAADANINGAMDWEAANAWVSGLTIGGVIGWRLPTVTPVNGSTFREVFSNNATADVGFAPTTIDGTDGGWRDGSNTPVSEMGHMYYVILGNLGKCTPDNANPSGCTVQTGWGLSNPGPFSNVQSNDYFTSFYWTRTELHSSRAWDFNFFDGTKSRAPSTAFNSAWAVHDGDVAPPTPEELIVELVNVVIALNLQQGISNALDSKLENALKVLEDANTNNNVSATNKLYAFIYSVEAQRGNKITDADADSLIAAAQAIIDSLSE